MRKADIIRDNQRLKLDNERLRLANDELKSDIDKYKKAIESLRAFYGEKLVELENKRLLNLHPDIYAADVEWYPADINRFLTSTIHNYNFIYEIKGEINRHEIRQF